MTDEEAMEKQAFEEDLKNTPIERLLEFSKAFRKEIRSRLSIKLKDKPVILKKLTVK